MLFRSAVLLSASLSVAGELEHVGNIRPDGNMDGKLFSQGCRGGDSANVRFVAKVEGGVIEGYVNFSALTRGRPNSYEIDQRKEKGFATFKFEIRPDGSFGSWDRKDQMFLRQHSSGDDKFQWVRGKITGEGHVIVNMKFG